MPEMASFQAIANLQRSSHSDLIELVTAPSPAAEASSRPDAIIVPASRSPKSLITAICLARDVDCYLVVLCSRGTRATKLRSLFGSKGLTKGTAVDIPPAYALPRLRLETTDWVKHGPGRNICGGRESDLSVKRNVGLLLARMLGWERIFFMDDDIRGLAAGDVARTVSLLDRGFRSAGMQVKQFPDNSVVCHARREVKEDQEVFLSGSLLAVDATKPIAFFPDIYNEDWLFFHQDVAARKMATPGLLMTKMVQMSYNPFADPQRAAREEFGDVIAEGLYALLHRGKRPEDATREYWEQFIDSRNHVLDVVGDRLDQAPPELRAGIDKAILTARDTLAQITPASCADYIETWQGDLSRWANRLAETSVVPTVEDALRELGLDPLGFPGRAT